MSESGNEYGDVQLTRHLGKGVTVDTAPQRAKMYVGALASNMYLRIDGGDIVIADQAAYRIAGYDPADCTLTLELLNDWRPGQKDDPNAKPQT